MRTHQDEHVMNTIEHEAIRRFLEAARRYFNAHVS